MSRWDRSAARLLAVTGLVVLLAATTALAGGGKVKNGDFEKGNFKGWERSQAGNSGNVYLYDKKLLNDPASAPGALQFALENQAPKPRGKYSAIIAQDGPGNRALWQVLKLPKQAKSLSLRTFWDNGAGPWTWTGDFEYAGMALPNQFFTIDLLKAKADPLSGDGPKLLKKVFRPKGDTALDSDGWEKVNIKVRKLAGRKVLLRLAEVDNQGNLAVGLDDVKVKKKKKK